jgi:hypothetical protein
MLLLHNTMGMFVSLVTRARQSLTSIRSCFYPIPDAQFDLESYLGTWYQVAGTPFGPTRGARCISAKYSLNVRAALNDRPCIELIEPIGQRHRTSRKHGGTGKHLLPNCWNCDACEHGVRCWRRIRGELPWPTGAKMPRTKLYRARYVEKLKGNGLRLTFLRRVRGRLGDCTNTELEYVVHSEQGAPTRPCYD